MSPNGEVRVWRLFAPQLACTSFVQNHGADCLLARASCQPASLSCDMRPEDRHMQAPHTQTCADSTDRL